MEAPKETPLIRKYELPTNVPWEVTDKTQFSQFTDILTKNGLVPPDPLIAYRGGGMLAPSAKELAPAYAHFLSSERFMAVIPVTQEPGGKLEQVVHFPTKKEEAPFDVNLATYKLFVGNYVSDHWNAKENGPPPIPEVKQIDNLDDGRVVTVSRYRPYLRGLGKGAGLLGIKEMDTKRISPEELKHVVQVLDAIHPTVSDFRAWTEKNGQSLPGSSWLSDKNSMTAARGQEWWINPDAPTDRLRELSEKVRDMDKDFRRIDPEFNAEQSLEQMIRNNIALFPHQNGTIDNPDLAADTVITHGTIYPENIHQNIPRDGGKPTYTVFGGDRAHVGLRGEMIDWLVAASAESPAHQHALLKEFMTLHPGEKDRRGLAMHVLYRSIHEASWFAKQNAESYGNLVKITHDILTSKGVWESVNTPLLKSTA